MRPAATLDTLAFERSPSAARTHAWDGALVVTVSVVLPVAMYLAHVAPLARFVYPASNFAVAAYLFTRRSPWYAAHCLLVFLFVSLVRRLVDEQAGWDPSNPVLFTPYLCCLLTAVSFVDYWSRPQPRHIGAFLLILSCVTYGALLAVIDGRPVAGAIDLVKWAIGPLFAIHMLTARESLSQVRQIIEFCLVGAGSAMAAYGILQFVHPAPWDIDWMNGVMEQGMTSIGAPQPYAVRVFSTMNSPASFGAIMCAGTIVALKRTPPIAIPAVALMLTGLALCQYRSIWAAAAVGVMLLVVTRPGALRPRNLAAAALLLCAVGATAFVPQVQDAVAQRARSLTELGSDASLDSRLSQYRAFIDDEDLIRGTGLGLNGAARKFDNLARVVIDSGLIDIWRSLGIIVGTLFMLGIGALIVSSWSAAPGLAHHLDFDRALVIAVFLQLPMASVHMGESGFCGWLFLGLALASLAGAASASRASSIDPLRA